MKADVEQKNGFTEVSILGAIGGAIAGGAIGFASGAVLPALVGGALVGSAVSQWVADMISTSSIRRIRNKREKGKDV